MMKAIAASGSPRKKWNTATLLNKALEGAASKGAEAEMIHLYELNFKGCISCFKCKLNGGESYGRCAVRDDLMPVLERIGKTDILILGSPIYFGMITGESRSFIERLLFQYTTYDIERSSKFRGKIFTGFIYTMNVSHEGMLKNGYDQVLKSVESSFKRILGRADPLVQYVNDTYQIEDYKKYGITMFDEKSKLERRKTVFPEDCRKAYEMGERLAVLAGQYGMSNSGYTKKKNV